MGFCLPHKLTSACVCLQATGKVHTLWTAFARFYERHNDLENARVIFEKATQARCRLHFEEPWKFALRRM